MAETVVVIEGTPEPSAGMPQLDTSTFDNQIFWLILALLAIYFILTRVALPRIGGVLAERQGALTNDIAAAEELKLKAEEAERAYDKSLADARSEAAGIADKTKAEFQEELNREMEKADAEIAEQTAEAEQSIATIRGQSRDVARDAAVEAAEAIVSALGGQADRARISAAVDERMKSL